MCILNKRRPKAKYWGDGQKKISALSAIPQCLLQVSAHGATAFTLRPNLPRRSREATDGDNVPNVSRVL